ncbi:hypothetical protein [Parapedobacter sp. 2B3]|uniref:hypothetical protein n=1 Tax=Parapedobacter sp. 2B3 TaxID=3342381 RepID=UPI0035B67986
MEKATTPEELPRLVTEAWNARRADWLAAFFSTMYLASSPLRMPILLSMYPSMFVTPRYL